MDAYETRQSITCVLGTVYISGHPIMTPNELAIYALEHYDAPVTEFLQACAIETKTARSSAIYAIKNYPTHPNTKIMIAKTLIALSKCDPTTRDHFVYVDQNFTLPIPTQEYLQLHALMQYAREVAYVPTQITTIAEYLATNPDPNLQHVRALRGEDSTLNCGYKCIVCNTLSSICEKHAAIIRRRQYSDRYQSLESLEQIHKEQKAIKVACHELY